MNKHSFRRLLLGVLVGGLTLAVPLFQAQAMTVSPVRVELAGDPGKSVGGFFKVINEEQEAKTLYTVFENFEPMGETGSPSFKTGNEGLASWITAPKEVTIAPGETKTVDFAVNIPADAEPGGYFAAIFLATTPPDISGNQLSIGARVGTLLLFRVNGDIKEGGALLEFKTKDNNSWYNSLPVNFYYRFQNSGADRVMPKGSLNIKNIFGMSTKVINANLGQGNVLPRSIRRFELWWQKGTDSTIVPELQSNKLGFFEAAKYQWNNFAFGRYRADLDISYGTKSEKVVSSFVVWVFPWQLLLIELVGLIIVLVVLGFIIKRYNKWIIRRARS
ncbi:MAG: hypothetical protein NTY12_01305 [Candidatus Falkowbacteria bacterium]|nr:hypothetical protein [Candidatus Falkowbacteria bacterium]